MVNTRLDIGTWLLWSAVGMLLALSWSAGSQVGAFDYVPMNHDAFYHARRILDTVKEPAAFYQFDQRIHAPEGSILVWPWGYDFLAAMVVRAVGGWTGADPALVLAHLPPVWVALNVALVVLILRALGLPAFYRFAGAGFYTLLPLTLHLHGFYVVDHHFIEHAFVLVTLLVMVRWASHTHSVRLGALAGVAMGLAPAFHPGLFILQLPLVVVALLLWLQRRGLGRTPLLVCATALVLSTLIALLPSLPFQRGIFLYYYHSWFHLYVASAVALSLLWFARVGPSPARQLQYAMLAAASLLPMIGQIPAGAAFLGGELTSLAEMQEVTSPVAVALGGSVWRIIGLYSPLILAAPLVVAWGVASLRSRAAATHLVLAIFSLFGLALLAIQLRMHYFGTFALFMPVLMIAHSWLRPAAARHKLVALLVMVAPLVGVRYLLERPGAGDSIEYQLMRPLYLALATQCARAPGIVLANQNEGHYIRFHTECSVIANNFIMTPQHEQKIRLSEELLAGDMTRLEQQAPYVRYVLVKRADNFLGQDSEAARTMNTGLRRFMLGAPLPPELKTITRLQVARPDGSQETIAALYEVVGAASGGTATPGPASSADIAAHGR